MELVCGVYVGSGEGDKGQVGSDVKCQIERKFYLHFAPHLILRVGQTFISFVIHRNLLLDVAALLSRIYASSLGQSMVIDEVRGKNSIFYSTIFLALLRLDFFMCYFISQQSHHLVL